MALLKHISFATFEGPIYRPMKNNVQLSEMVGWDGRESGMALKEKEALTWGQE